MLAQEVYPLAFIWRTGIWSTFTNILQDALRGRRPEGLLDDARDFLLDRLDDGIEPLVRKLAGKPLWDEMKENALLAGEDGGGVREVVEAIGRFVGDDVEVHVAGHSAGCILLGPVVSGLTERGRKIESCTLWAPACTIGVFDTHYRPAIEANQVRRFGLFTLTDDAEQDDNCADIYHKSLLYLVDNALEEVPSAGRRQREDRILGLEHVIRGEGLSDFLAAAANADWVLSPNDRLPGDASASKARRHGDFDDDEVTVKALVSRITSQDQTGLPDFAFPRSGSSLRDTRQQLLG